MKSVEEEQIVKNIFLDDNSVSHVQKSGSSRKVFLYLLLVQSHSCWLEKEEYITHQTASGLSFSGTLVHCDVRKDNIFAVSESEVLLNDWGSACYEKEGVLREASGNILDSLIQDKEVKVRSNGDLHALARTVYRLFCQPSFEYLTNECQEFWANRSKLWLYRDF